MSYKSFIDMTIDCYE